MKLVAANGELHCGCGGRYLKDSTGIHPMTAVQSA
jgi:hypothetical protein